MTDLLIFEAFGYFGVCERSYHIVTGYFAPSFPSRENADLFVAWLSDWRRTNALWPTEIQQQACAERIALFLAPILGTELERVASTVELYQWFRDKQRGARAA